MQPNSARARDRAYVVHQHTNLAATSGMWSASLGFSEHGLAEVAYRQMKSLPYYHTFYTRGHLPSVDLAEKLLGMAPRQAEGGAAHQGAVQLLGLRRPTIV